MDLDNTEEKQAPLLAAIKKKNPFVVPEGYFEESTLRILSQTRLPDAGQEGFTVPAGYFDELESQITDRVFLEKLDGLNSNAGFSVPENYFAQLNTEIRAKVEPVKPAGKIVKMRSWIQYAAAACVTIAIGTALLINQQDPATTNVAKQEINLSDIPDEEIISYLQLHGDSPEIQLIAEGKVDATMSSGLSTDELQQYLNNTL